MTQPSSPAPYLSIVAASRNDDHGGDPLRRTQIFINCFARQCEKFRLPAEIILVDWNPVPDRPGLADVLTIPEGSTYCSARVVTVPSELHLKIKYGDRLGFFQMIAKNAGIRRAKGQFVVATNIDIIFSDELVSFIAKQKLDPAHCYRADRHDTDATLTPADPVEKVLAQAWSRSIRKHRRYAPKALIEHIYPKEGDGRKCHIDPEFLKGLKGIRAEQSEAAWMLIPDRKSPMEHLHTNGCGDFTLLARDAWDTIRGYPEFEAFSFNIDSMGFMAAHYAGLTEAALLPPCVTFHIEHSIGSGWTPEGERKLFDRMEAAGILNPDWPVLTPIVDRMREMPGVLHFNDEDWGFARFDLPESNMATKLPKEPVKTCDKPPATWPAHRVIALKPEFDLDRLTLIHERKERAKARLAAPANTAKERAKARLAAPANTAEERARLETERNCFHLERNAFLSERQTFAQERNNIANEYNTVAIEHQLLADARRIERNAFLSERQIFAQERNNLANEYNTLAIEHQSLADARRKNAQDNLASFTHKSGETHAGPDVSRELLEIFIPDAEGGYSAERKLTGAPLDTEDRIQSFCVPEYEIARPLRIDPGGRSGAITLRRLDVVSVPSSKHIADLGSLLAKKVIKPAGSATFVEGGNGVSENSLLILSHGDDPQIHLNLESFKAEATFPLIVVIEAAFSGF